MRVCSGVLALLVPGCLAAAMQFDRNQDLLLLYSLSKAGTTSLATSFANLLLRDSAESGSYPNYFKTRRGTTIPSVPAWNDQLKRLRKYPKYFKTHNYMVATDFINKSPPRSHIWIVTVVRAPFDRMVSLFFHEHVRTRRNHKVSAAHLCAQFANLPCVTTFLSEFRRATGVQLAASAGDFRDGHLKVDHVDSKGRRYTILLVRTEDAGEWTRILGAYFSGFELETAGATSLKWYGDLYSKFKESCSFTKGQSKRLMGWDVMRFYNTSEKKAMLDRWAKRGGRERAVDKNEHAGREANLGAREHVGEGRDAGKLADLGAKEPVGEERGAVGSGHQAAANSSPSRRGLANFAVIASTFGMLCWWRNL